MVAGHLVKLQGGFIITSPAHSWIYKLYLFLTNIFLQNSAVFAGYCLTGMPY